MVILHLLGNKPELEIVQFVKIFFLAINGKNQNMKKYYNYVN